MNKRNNTPKDNSLWKKIAGILSSAFVSYAFLLLCSTATSPLYPNNYSYDSAFFRFIGREILEGNTPYIDVWDHKGPVLFFLQALGAIGGSTNKGTNILFLMQIISLWISIIFMYKTFLVCSHGNVSLIKFIACLVTVLSIFSLTIEGGNLSEEWCLPMICGSLYMMASYAMNADKTPDHPPLYAFLHGINIALIIFIRANNAIPICAGIMVIGIFLMNQKKWKNLLQSILFGLLGLGIVTVPIFVWFAWRGAFKEMIFAVFTFNLQYSVVRSFIPYTGEPMVTRYLPVLAAFLIFITDRIFSRRMILIDFIAAAVLISGIWMMTDTNVYLHYFTVFLPILFFIPAITGNRSSLPIILILLPVFSWFGWLNYQRFPDLLATHRQKQMFTAAERIPEEDRDSIIAVNLPPELYLNYGLHPVSRFCAYQQIHLTIAPEMKAEFLETLQNNPPSWILAFCSGETKIPEVQKLIDSEYIYRFDQSKICYYERK